MDKNPPTKFKDAVILHLANKYINQQKSSTLKQGAKNLLFGTVKIKNRKPFSTLLCTLRAVVSPGWTLRCEGRETTAIASLIGRRLASWTSKLTLNRQNLFKNKLRLSRIFLR